MDDDPLMSLEVTELQKTIVWNEANYWLDWWRLVQQAFPQIEKQARAAGIEFPFESSAELFCRAVSDCADHQFSICLSAYTEVSAKQIGIGAQDILKSQDIFQTELSTKKQMSAHGRGRARRAYIKELQTSGRDDWELLAVYLSKQSYLAAQKKFKLIGDRLKALLRDGPNGLEGSSAERLKQQATAGRRKRQWSEIIEPAFRWEKGEKIYVNSA
jgi:hypothetical protein